MAAASKDLIDEKTAAQPTDLVSNLMPGNVVWVPF